MRLLAETFANKAQVAFNKNSFSLEEDSDQLSFIIDSAQKLNLIWVQSIHFVDQNIPIFPCDCAFT